MNTPTTSPPIWLFLWAISGVSLILFQAIWKLFPLVMQLYTEHTLSIPQWFFLSIWVAFMGYTEGYRGFQKAFCPRVVARAWTLHTQAPFLHLLLAPLYSMGYFYATRKRKIVAWSITTGIVGIVLFVKILPAPYRNIIDAGVVVGLTYGLTTLLVFTAQALFGSPPTANPDLPESHTSPTITSP